MIFLFLKRCVRSFVPPIPFRSRAHVGLSNTTGLRYPASVLRLWTKAISNDSCESYRHDTPFESVNSKLDMFHEQLPLPVPCYDLVLVTEFAVVPANAGPSGTPSSLDLTGECDTWQSSRSHVASGFPALRESVHELHGMGNTCCPKELWEGTRSRN